MARSRNIKPGFFQNDALAECDPLARILFAGLWCEADRAGRLLDRPKKIKVACLPYDDCNIEDMLGQLARRGFIRRYVVDSTAIIQVTGFDKHQNPHKKEAESVLPPEPTEQAQCEHHASTVLDPENPELAGRIPDSGFLIPDSGFPQQRDAPQTDPPEGKQQRSPRGSRLSPDWQPSVELVAWAAAERPDVDLQSETARFRDYWAAKAGKDGVKLDWDATFRNWIRNARQGPTKPGRNSSPPEMPTLELT